MNVMSKETGRLDSNCAVIEKIQEETYVKYLLVSMDYLTPYPRLLYELNMAISCMLHLDIRDGIKSVTIFVPDIISNTPEILLDWYVGSRKLA